MASRLFDRLTAARQRLIVGRAAEQATFQEALLAEELPFLLLHVYGPGGVGKTTLLNEFRQLCAQVKTPAYSLDARNLEASPEAFLGALLAAIGIPATESPFAYLAAQAGKSVILIDTCEMLAPLDDWLSRNFLPQLPENVLVVLAGRQPPSPAWRVDPGWQSLVHILPLRNLSPGESRSYLLKRDIPLESHQAILDFTHGHPLALSLVAEVYGERPGAHFQPEESPDIVKTLLEQFVQKAPSPLHRAALEACALVRTTTEPLLEVLLGPASGQDAHELFEWLRGLSFIESGREGLFPHDLARESLVADLRWRNPDQYAELHRRAREYFITRLGQASGTLQQYILQDYIYLHRDNPLVRPFFEWQLGGSLLSDGLRPGDIPAVKELVARFEGPRSAEIAVHWMERQPYNVVILRDAEGQVAGCIVMVSIHRATEADLQVDEAIRKAAEFLRRRAPLRAGEVATHFRFWLARDTYHAISPTQTLIIIHLVRHYLTTPGLAYTFFPVADAAFWGPLAAYANILPIPELDYVVDGRQFGVFGHDWRTEPPLAWLGMLAEREIAMAPEPPALKEPSQPLVVLSQADFAAAVQDALRFLTRPDGLQGNPLLRSRLVLEKSGSEADGPQSLRALVRQAIELLGASPKESKLHRALYHTYIQPAPTQEAAAELLDLPFSTYRRHLRGGVVRVVEILWGWEIGGGDK